MIFSRDPSVASLVIEKIILLYSVPLPSSSSTPSPSAKSLFSLPCPIHRIFLDKSQVHFAGLKPLTSICIFLFIFLYSRHVWLLHCTKKKVFFFSLLLALVPPPYVSVFPFRFLSSISSLPSCKTASFSFSLSVIQQTKILCPYESCVYISFVTVSLPRRVFDTCNLLVPRFCAFLLIICSSKRVAYTSFITLFSFSLSLRSISLSCADTWPFSLLSCVPSSFIPRIDTTNFCWNVKQSKVVNWNDTCCIQLSCFFFFYFLF